ncbi:hypothetical protein OPV22_025580 [Ensete ventricosum]|uniref:Uncharacterized protein n=1 Tax=Ensete ventricosum TaxID=4639 RepID=A0AAV8QFW9_ENSVE|nr:hypothetical protein OPV22_025580 [Ensete ventricosum]
MLGTSLQWGPAHQGDRSFIVVKPRRNHTRQHQRSPQRSRCNPSTAAAGVSPAAPPVSKDAGAVAGVADSRESNNQAGLEEPPSKSLSVAPRLCNLDRFLESTTPSFPAQYLSKTTIKGWRTCDVKFKPFFALSDLWESFKEWSAYGVGVPLLLHGNEYSVIQYYVPFLSGIQLYGQSCTPSASYRQMSQESEGDCLDSSSDGSDEYESEKGLNYSSEWTSIGGSNLRMNKLYVSGKQAQKQDGSSSDDDNFGNSQGHLLFEFLEQDPPFIREPLADKISDLARHFPALRTLRSCDLLPSSWLSVAWYPIYRIPTGPTLKDLDACFLTFHSLSTPAKDDGSACPSITHSQEVDGVHMISLPIFGLASYKFKSTVWTPNGGSELQLANSLLQDADNWLRLHHVEHPDYKFFASHGAYRR